MNNKQLIRDLAEFNVRVNLGSYEDSWEEILSGVFYVSSLRMPDVNCNLGYRRDGATPLLAEIKAIELAAAAKSREPAIWRVAGKNIPKGFQATEPRVWMIADTAAELPRVAVPKTHIHIHSPLPTAEMADVFDMVYCQGKGDVGYNSIAHDYVDVFRNIAPNPPAKAFHIGVDIDNVCVAICNVNLIGDMTGLYSVAVLPEYRRRGLGRLVVMEGVKVAAQKGATRVLLQTAPDSPMQTLYESVGFKPVFISELLVRA